MTVLKPIFLQHKIVSSVQFSDVNPVPKQSSVHLIIFPMAFEVI